MSRFHIKVNPRGGVALKDRHSPAFVQTYASLEAACLAMDNRVRRELGYADRLPITRREVRDAMRTSSQAGLARSREVREAMATYARIDREKLDEEMRREPRAVRDAMRISSQAGLASIRRSHS